MTWGFALFTAGLALLIAGIRGQSIGEVLSGAIGSDQLASAKYQQYATTVPGSGPKHLGKVSGGAAAGVNGAVLSFVSNLGAILGKPLTISSGLRPGAHTDNGSISDHASGNAADVPFTGRALIKAGQLALVLAGMPYAQAKHAQGGIYNVGHWQIIFNTYEGGDHTNHLHIGYKASR